MDVDALAQALFGFPVDALEGGYSAHALGETATLQYTLLDITANLGLRLAQDFTFVPTSVNATLTSSTGETHTGRLGQDHRRR